MLDNDLVLSDAQAITATAVSTKSYDAGEQAVNLGAGEPIEFAVGVVTADFNSLTSLTIEVIAADDAALTSNVVVLERSGAVPLADLTVGERPFRGTINPGPKKRYYGFNYVVTGTNPTTGALTSYLGQKGSIPDQEYYNKAYTNNVTV